MFMLRHVSLKTCIPWTPAVLAMPPHCRMYTRPSYPGSSGMLVRWAETVLDGGQRTTLWEVHSA